MSFRSSGQSGFTLIELLAAIVSIVVVLGAATGFVITAVVRQKIVLEASQLEASHSQLADAIYSALKVADDFQIFDNAIKFSTATDNSYGSGVPNGNYLSCRHDTRPSGGTTGMVEQDFEFIPRGPNGAGSLVQTTRFLSIRRPEVQRVCKGVTATGPVFSMKDGIPQAHWSVVTSLDRADFNVYAMPLDLR